MGYIEDMRNLVGNHPLILIGSHAIILNEKNEILLQLRTDFNQWGIIGGALEYNETLEDALKREVYEETGLIIKIQNYSVHTQDEISFKSIKRQSSTRCTRCLYLPRIQGELVCDHTESKELRFFRLMSYLVIFLLLLRGLLMSFNTQFIREIDWLFLSFIIYSNIKTSFLVMIT